MRGESRLGLGVWAGSNPHPLPSALSFLGVVEHLSRGDLHPLGTFPSWISPSIWDVSIMEISIHWGHLCHGYLHPLGTSSSWESPSIMAISILEISTYWQHLHHGHLHPSGASPSRTKGGQAWCRDRWGQGPEVSPHHGVLSPATQRQTSTRSSTASATPPRCSPAPWPSRRSRSSSVSVR